MRPHPRWNTGQTHCRRAAPGGPSNRVARSATAPWQGRFRAVQRYRSRMSPAAALRGKRMSSGALGQLGELVCAKPIAQDSFGDFSQGAWKVVLAVASKSRLSHSLGNRSSTCGRASASKTAGFRVVAERASTSWTVGKSPQCRSSARARGDGLPCWHAADQEKQNESDHPSARDCCAPIEGHRWRLLVRDAEQLSQKFADAFVICCVAASAYEAAEPLRFFCLGHALFARPSFGGWFARSDETETLRCWDLRPDPNFEIGIGQLGLAQEFMTQTRLSHSGLCGDEYRSGLGNLHNRQKAQWQAV